MSVYSSTLQYSANAETFSASGQGDSVDLGVVTTEYVLYAFASGGSVTLSFQGSLDGTNWYSVGNITGSEPIVNGLAARYVRVSVNVGSGSPVVTGYVAAPVDLPA